ncbi:MULTISPECIES: putative RNA methyltransferase [unclassified Cytobacillus]|uniref:putative RNA methyltransferase n=1 Tax=unclassified Cytobacillus TaxID=2675268 RepID=UPI00203FCE3C|nr:methyltransferase domain-containing protein [Cytobacillus sp. AMY 15.2]MCM3093637.1 methyltransferase domain-containing protein [Cytobacillus sp. AMY 15.2]
MDSHAKYKNYVNALRCPLCEDSLQVFQSKSLLCPNRHTFDISHHGYVNMLSHSPKSRYNKVLFEARKKIIMESELFTLLHEKISAVIDSFSANFDALLLDAGCGEGSHLEKVLGNSRNGTVTGIGLDISKAGIAQAAKRYKNSIWLVGDLAKSPLADHSVNMILNIFSPSNYKEFKRILVPGGLIIKVVPRTAHLKELRNAIHGANENSTYRNDETISLFNKHFTLADVITVSDARELNESERTHLVLMSPLAWDANETALQAFVTQSGQITIDADILIGLNQNETRLS